jgi:hypothetical protein
MDIQMVRNASEKLDIIASELQETRPELALALDLISDKMERQAFERAAFDESVSLLQRWCNGSESVSEDTEKFLSQLGAQK